MSISAPPNLVNCSTQFGKFWCLHLWFVCHKLQKFTQIQIPKWDIWRTIVQPKWDVNTAQSYIVYCPTQLTCLEDFDFHIYHLCNTNLCKHQSEIYEKQYCSQIDMSIPAPLLQSLLVGYLPQIDWYALCEKKLFFTTT